MVSLIKHLTSSQHEGIIGSYTTIKLINMDNPSCLLNPCGKRRANIKWTVCGPEEFNLAMHISNWVDRAHVELVNISSRKTGVFKDTDEVSFKVFGLESDLYVFFSELEQTLKQVNDQIDDYYGPGPKEGFFKRLFKR